MVSRERERRRKWHRLPAAARTLSTYKTNSAFFLLPSFMERDEVTYTNRLCRPDQAPYQTSQDPSREDGPGVSGMQSGIEEPELVGQVS